MAVVEGPPSASAEFGFALTAGPLWEDATEDSLIVGDPSFVETLSSGPQPIGRAIVYGELGRGAPSAERFVDYPELSAWTPGYLPPRFGHAVELANVRAWDDRFHDDSYEARLPELVVGAPGHSDYSGGAGGAPGPASGAGQVWRYRTADPTAGTVLASATPVAPGLSAGAAFGTALAAGYGQDRAWADVAIGAPGRGVDNGGSDLTKAVEVLPCAPFTGEWQAQDASGTPLPERIRLLTAPSYVDRHGVTQPAQSWLQFADDFQLELKDSTGAHCTFEDENAVVHASPGTIPAGARIPLIEHGTSGSPGYRTFPTCSAGATVTFADARLDEVAGAFALDDAGMGEGTIRIYSGVTAGVNLAASGSGPGATLDLTFDLSALPFGAMNMDPSCQLVGTSGVRGAPIELSNPVEVCE